MLYFNTWASHLAPIATYLRGSDSFDVRTRLPAGASAELEKQARLDCDWYAENARCLASLSHSGVQIAEACVSGPSGLLKFLSAERPPATVPWLIFMGQQPQNLESAAGRAFQAFRCRGARILYYAFDEASRFMPCFRAIAPHLDVLIHDEAPLDRAGEGALRPDCLRIHRSWVANFVPFSVPFNEAPERKILFLGSQLGLTDHRRRQIEFLKKRFKDRFVPSTDHSVSVADRGSLNRYKVGLCPEGRKFTTPAMSETHTDRPFWSGCLGLVPVSENSKAGNRLDALANAGLIVRYPHGDLNALGDACERALEMPDSDRRRIYDHFNRHETIGTVVADAIALATVQQQKGDRSIQRDANPTVVR